MSSIKLIISDLHLADGHPMLDGFGDFQQAAFEGLTSAARAGGPLGQADDVELIINGDCFDFLATPPYDTAGISDVSTALEKAKKIIAAHGPFFETLRRFIDTTGRHVTFLTGNHDIDLRFEEVRAQMAKAIGGEQRQLYFCPTRFYRPLPDVHIEHGNHYDFWNSAMDGQWVEDGQPLDLRPGIIVLPAGSHYFQHAAHPISIRYAYFDRFEPSMNSMRQIALLCLLNPDMIIETAKLTKELFSQRSTQQQALAGLAEGEEQLPASLFEYAMTDFVAFQQEMMVRNPDWVEPGGRESSQVEANMMMEFTMLREALKLPLIEAVATICTPTTYEMGEGVAAGMHAVLKNDAELRYAIAGHTHMVRIETVHNGAQSYLNTASWTTRLALPAPGEVNAALVEWLRHPNWEQIPLRDVTRLIFAIVNATEASCSSASLCVWEGGTKGSYRVLA